MTETRQDAQLPASTDVLVIGAGAGGAAAAWALVRQGISVTLIDAGPAYSSAEYKVADNDWEYSGLPAKPGSQGRHEIVAGQPLDERWDSLKTLYAPRARLSEQTVRRVRGYSHMRGIGGTTLHFTGWMHRLHPEAFEMQTRFGVAADWPLTYDELEPYYAMAEQMVGVAGPETVPGRPRSTPFPTPAHLPSTLSQAVAHGGRKLGLSFVPNPVAAPSVPYAGRPDCNFCGCCMHGCPRGDKGSADLTFVAPAVSSGHCKVLPRHTLIEFRRGAQDTLTGAVIADAYGNQHEIAASHYVLAAGAVETPRLLLLMDGLGNESGLVGRNFMETLTSGQTGLHPEQIGSHRGYPEDTICWDFNAPDSIPNIPGGAILLPTVASLGYIGPGRYAEQLVDGFGTEFKRRLLNTFGRAAGIMVICENLPNPRSFVSLSKSLTDEFGRPSARIDSFLPDIEVERLAFATGKARDLLLAAGVPKIQEAFSTYDSFSSSHVFGTCRMGTDPEASVVNASQRSHRWKNLWISDASVFPSSGSGEAPSLTIHALAIRMADRLAAQARNQA